MGGLRSSHGGRSGFSSLPSMESATFTRLSRSPSRLLTTHWWTEAAMVACCILFRPVGRPGRTPPPLPSWCGIDNERASPLLLRPTMPPLGEETHLLLRSLPPDQREAPAAGGGTLARRADDTGAALRECWLGPLRPTLPEGPLKGVGPPVLSPEQSTWRLSYLLILRRPGSRSDVSSPAEVNLLCSSATTGDRSYSSPNS